MGEASNNDLSAFMYRLYLEGKIDEEHTEAFAETIIGYTNPSVNESDENREAACEAAFKNAFGEDAEYVEKEIEMRMRMKTKTNHNYIYNTTDNVCNKIQYNTSVQ